MTTNLQPAQEPEISSNSPNAEEQKQTLQSVLVFDRPDGHVDVDLGVPRLSGNFTIEIWIHPTSDSGISIIYAEGDSIFYIENNFLKFKKYTTGETISSTDGSITPYAWNHVAVVKSGNKAGDTKLYINGQQNDNQSLTPKLSGAKNAYIGMQPGVDDQHFIGKISELRIWNSPRSPEEIEQNLPHRLVGNEPGLVGYWSFSEGFGTIAHDKTPNAKHANICNATWSESVIPIADDPDPKERLLYSTKVEDYRYLFSKLAENQAVGQKKVYFRRGRIWH